MKTFLVYVSGMDGIAEAKAKNITFHNFKHQQSHEDLDDIMFNEFFHGFTVHGSIEI